MITQDESILFRKAASCFRAVNHKLRTEILLFISEQARTVTEIYVHFRIEQSVASQHLRVLREAGLVQTRREGKEVHYSLNSERIDQMVALSKDLTA